MFRFKLGQLGLAMVAIGVGLAALVRATPGWVSLTYTASLAAFTAAALAALFAPRRSRPFWAGAALTALIYVVAARSFPRPLEAAPAWAIRTWAEGNGPIAFNPFPTPATQPMTTITVGTPLTAPATATSVVDTLLAGTPAATSPVPATIPVTYYTAPGPTPATLQQAAATQLTNWDPIWYSSPLSSGGPAAWSRGNAGLIAEMEAVWLASLAGGWLARRFARRAETEAVDGRAG